MAMVHMDWRALLVAVVVLGHNSQMDLQFGLQDMNKWESDSQLDIGRKEHMGQDKGQHTFAACKPYPMDTPRKISILVDSWVDFRYNQRDMSILQLHCLICSCCKVRMEMDDMDLLVARAFVEEAVEVVDDSL